MKIINSHHNPLVKEVCSLHTAKGRSDHMQFIGQGIRVIKTLIENKIPIARLYCTKDQVETAQSLASDSIITQVPESVMIKMSTAKTASGILGVFQLPKKQSLSSLTPGLVLVDIADPGNMGTLIRTAAAMGIKTVVCVGGVDPYNPKVIQSTAGTISMVTLYQTDWNTLLENKGSLPLCALVVSGGKNPNQANIANSLLVVGSEAHGLPDEYVAQCDEKMTIPMPGETESLNAAVAGSIALYLGFVAS